MGDCMEYNLDSNKLIGKFRIITLVFSTLLFLFDRSEANNFDNNFVVIVCLTISNILLIHFLNDITLTENKILLLIFLESFGMMFILGFSGMIYSYYFWMWLNPIITNLVKIKNKKIKEIVNLILIIIVICLLLLNKKYIQGYVTSDNINVILGFFITVIFSSMISKILYQQEIIKSNLKASKEVLEKNLQVNKEITTNIVNSIELTERLSIVENYDEMVKIIIEFFNLVIKRGKSFFAIKKDCSEFVIHGEFSEEEETNIKILLQQYDSSKEIKQININKDTILMFNSVKYREGTNYFGIVVSNEHEIIDVVKQQLVFVQKLCKIIYSKIKLQELRKELLISEEQNRIAEEIHDNVNQQIFSISCLAFNIKERIESADEKDFKKNIGEMIDQLYNSLKRINKEIKNIVYRMSMEKENKENVIVNFDKYLDELSFIYNIKIKHNITEKVSDFNINIKNSIFRILNESISNAVRHGKADNICIIILAENKTINIEINDNGIGFNIDELDSKQNGLGIYSMKKLATLSNGTFQVISKIGKGTCIKINLLME